MVSSLENSLSQAELIQRLNNGDQAEKRSIIEGIGRNKLTFATDSLIDILQNTKTWYGLRLAAARALGQLDDHKAVPALILALGDPDSDVRQAAAKSLELLGRGEIGKAVLRLLDNQPGGLHSYKRGIAEEAIGLAFLESDVRGAAARAIGDLGLENFSQFLLARLLDPNERYYSKEIIYALGKLKYSPAADIIIEFLKDEDLATRLAAIEALGEIPNFHNGSYLCELIDDPNTVVRIAALRAISKFRSEGTKTIILDHLYDPSRVFRALSAKALIDSGDTELGRAYLDALVGKTEKICALGQQALVLVPGIIAALDDNITEFRKSAISSLTEIGAVSLPILLKDFQESSNLAKEGIFKVITDIKDERAFTNLISGFQNEDPRLRLEIACSLAKFGGETFNFLLCLLASEKNTKILDGVIQTLGLIGDTRAIPQLQKVYQSNQLEVGGTVINSIEQITRANTNQFAHRWKYCICKEHATRFTQIKSIAGTKYYACRVCHRSDAECLLEPIEQIVAVVGKGPALPNNESKKAQERIMRVEWTAGKGMFDFSSVELLSDDFDDEGFVLEYMEDKDDFRLESRKKDQKISIKIAPGIRLSASTRARLQDYFQLYQKYL